VSLIVVNHQDGDGFVFSGHGDEQRRKKRGKSARHRRSARQFLTAYHKIATS
jgi:hypothetical protein